MRHLGLFLAFLTLLSLTTAMATSLDVRADNLSSSRPDVSITVPGPPPPPPVLYLIGDTELQLSETFVAGTGVDSLSLGAAEWTSDTYPDGFRVVDQFVDLVVYVTGGGGGLTARIYDCPTVTAPTVDCVQRTMATGDLGNNQQTLSFPAPSPPAPLNFDIEPGHVLRLRLANESGGSIKIQWGKTNPLRDSRLVFSGAPA